MEIFADISVDDICYPDYYSGHGHAFAHGSLIACQQFGFPVNYTETLKELVEGIMDDLDSLEPDFVKDFETSTEREEAEFLVRNFPEEKLRELCTKCLRKINNVSSEERVFNAEKITSDELPCIFGYVHYYRNGKEQK
jgi:hypothetical protein